MKKYIALLAGISIVLLTGCGSGADQSTVSIDGKGKVTAMTVESFDKSWYDSGSWNRPLTRQWPTTTDSMKKILSGSKPANRMKKHRRSP